jgi:hypothetical protein
MSHLLKWKEFFLEKELQLACSALDYPSEEIPAHLVVTEVKPFVPPTARSDQQPSSNASQIHKAPRKTNFRIKSDMDMSLEDTLQPRKNVEVKPKHKFKKLAMENRSKVQA